MFIHEIISAASLAPAFIPVQATITAAPLVAIRGFSAGYLRLPVSAIIEYGATVTEEIDDVTAQQIIDDILAGLAAHQSTLAAAQPNYAPSRAGDAMTLTGAYDAAKTAAQVGAAMTLTGAYDAAKTAAQPGSAMALTGAERIAVANEVEAQIIDESDPEKVLTAITNKIASVNPDLGGLTVGAIAAATATAVEPRFTAIDEAIGSIPGGSAATPEDIAAATATALDPRFDSIDSAIGQVTGGSAATPEDIAAEVDQTIAPRFAAFTFTDGNVNSYIMGVLPSLACPDLPTAAQVAAEVDQTIAPRFAGLSTYAGGPVEGVTGPVTVGTNEDKGGYSLAPTGLDSILMTLAAAPTNFREWLILGIHRLCGKSEKEKLSDSEAVIRIFGSDPGTVVTQQTVTTTSTKIQMGPPEAPEG